MKGHSLDDRALFVAAAAKLRSDDRKQQEIARILGVSQPEVSRLLVEARGKWLEKAPRFLPADQALWRAAEERFFSTAETRDHLHKVFPEGGKRLHRVTVLHGASYGHIDPNAAQVIYALLGDAASVGVTWGRTISSLVQALRERATEIPTRGSADRLEFVPLCGEPLMDVRDPSRHSSSVLAEQLAEICNSGTSDRAPSIAGVPAFIPLKLNKPGEVMTIRRLFGMVRGYERVFGPAGKVGAETPLVNKLDAILTSVGVADAESRGIFLRERIAAEDISERDLQRSVIGDIGGVLIPAVGISKADEERIARLNERWTGVRLHQVQACAEAARMSDFSSKKPGVLLLALGGRRLAVVHRCIELGLVNELIVDRELRELLSPEAPVTVGQRLAP